MDSTENALRKLKATISKLLGPEGCPWDREQTVQSLSSHLVEEAWEFLHAVKNGKTGEIVEELGDTLMLLLLISQVAGNEGSFSLEEVASRANEKLITRHPHVFGEVTVKNSGEVLQNWAKLKRKEGKKPASDGLPQIPSTFPALTQAEKIGKASSKQGFDWPDQGGPLSKISEEWGELKRAIAHGETREIEREMGDLLFSVANLSRFTGVDPETALRSACIRFRKRFAALVREGGNPLGVSLPKMEEMWKQTKERPPYDEP